ncbi:MAG: EAL domain-containing protein [Deltaproteobacteria bacterium]|nr:EAL domain-containing protein [Deltaproteobacteria bacterium]
MKGTYWITSTIGIIIFVMAAVILTKNMINQSIEESLGRSYQPVLKDISRIYDKYGDKFGLSSKEFVLEIGEISKSSGADWIKIYRLDGTRLFPAEGKEETAPVSRNKHFRLAAAGAGSGHLLSFPSPFLFSGTKVEVNHFSLFMPIRSPGDGSVSGVLEAGRDVTYLVTMISRRVIQVLAFLIALLLFLHLLIFFIIKSHDSSNEKNKLQSRKYGFSFFKYYDGLTRLPNRIMFMENLLKVISAEREGEKLLGVMYVGIDRLKMINNSLGHDAGNRVILEIVKRLRECTRGRDSLSRMSGDEFAIICEGALTVQNMEMLAERIMKNVRKPVRYEERELVVTSSAGFALFTEEIDNAERLVENANIAMRNTKRLGGNRFEFYSGTMSPLTSEQLELQIGLWNAVEEKEFVIFYQPKVNTLTGEVIGMEALLRWNHPKMGLIPPSRFIPLLEETGLMVPVGDWMIFEACYQTKKWHDEGYGNLRVSVNLSMCQFISNSLVDNIKKTLEISGLQPSLLEIELTESLLADDVDRAVASLKELKALGVKLALDDFGTGYSSLSHLTRFPIDILKVDRAFIKDVTVSSESATLTTAIVALAKSLHLEIVAEGVETLDHFNFVKDLGCEEIQGYFFSGPVPSEGFKMTLKSIEGQAMAML